MTERWPLIELIEVCETVVDCVNRTAPLAEGVTPYKMLRTTNIRDGFVDTENCRFVSRDVFEKWTRRQVPRRGDVILTREAPLGEVGMLRDDETVFLGQRVMSYRADPSKLDANFLLYSLMGPELQDQIRAFGSGATVEHMRVPDAERLKIRLPDLHTQQRIGAILAAYDKLFLNNQRRIAILDEMAQRIYERARLLSNGEVTPVSELIDTSLGGDWGEDGDVGAALERVRCIRGTDFKRITAGDYSTAPFRYVTQDSLSKRQLRVLDVVVENSINAKTRSAGTPLLITQGVLRSFVDRVVPTSFCRLFRCADPMHGYVLYRHMQWLHQSRRMEEFQVVAANGIANFQTRQFLDRCGLPLSTGEIHKTSIALQALDPTVYREQNGRLREARDFLLPKLISGEIDVLAAEETFAEAAE